MDRIDRIKARRKAARMNDECGMMNKRKTASHSSFIISSLSCLSCPSC
jgi:hypothetical protein